MSTKVQIHLKNKVIKMPKNSKKWPIIKRDLSVVMTSKKYQKKGYMLKITLIIKSRTAPTNDPKF